MEEEVNDSRDMSRMRCLMVLISYHHRNTEKIAKVMAEVLNADIVSPQLIKIGELQDYDLIGFGSGIYHGKNHRSLLDLVDRLAPTSGKKVFIFSTNGAPASFYGPDRQDGYRKMIDKAHRPLREKLRSKGYEIIGELSCPGFNTNGILRLHGGTNKGRPDDEDLREAEEFARELERRSL